jgi:tetratricopeptide (TPR) repeat protein
MISSQFLVELKRLFPQDTWSWMLVALRQDAVVWQSLEGTELGNRALEKLPAQPSKWSPAALSFLALDSEIRVEELSALPLKPLTQPLRGKAIRAYEAWLRDSPAPVALAQAGLLALSLRERRRLKGSWDGLTAEFGLRREAARTVLACLYGMIPDPFELLKALIRSGNILAQPRLALHALLSNPMPVEEQTNILRTLLGELPAADGQAVLRELSSMRPWLAATLAQNFLAQSQSTASQVVDRAESQDGQLDQLCVFLGDLLRQAEVNQIAAQPLRAASLLAESLKVAQSLQGHVSAQLAQSVTKAGESTSEQDQLPGPDVAAQTGLEAWKQAVQLLPDDPLYTAGLALALMDTGRLEEAQSILAAWQVGGRQPTHPAFLLVSALVAERLGDEESALRFAQQALTQVEAGQPLEPGGYNALARFFLQAGLIQDAARAAQAALDRFPLERELLELQAQVRFALGQHPAALTSAYLALAVGQLSDEAPALGGVHEGVQRLLIESLEAAGAWQAALDEWTTLFQSLEAPSATDLCALAGCALRAGKPEQTVAACQKSLQIDPNDEQAHQLLGEAALALGDLPNAVEHFQQATRLAPQQADLWLKLAQAHKLASQEAQALDVLRAASLAVPEEASVHLALGQAYLEQNAPTQALPSLRKAASLSSEPQVALQLGRTLRHLGHIDEARDILEGAYRSGGCGSPIDTHPKHDDEPTMDPELAFEYAKVLMAVGDYRKAVDVLEELVNTQPDNPAPCLELAKALLKIGGNSATVESAIFLLERTLLLCSNLRLSHPEQADYARMLEIEALTLLPEAYILLGELQKAEEAYEQALELVPPSQPVERARLALGLGRVALKLNQPEKALATLQEAARLDPNNSEIQRALSEANLACGHSQEAFDAAKATLDLKPQDLDTLVWFIEQGRRLDQSGQARAEVTQALQQATQLAPMRGDLLMRLGRMHLEDGNQKAALDSFRKLTLVEDEAHPVLISDLYEAAKTSRQLGDAALAVSLMGKAIEESTEVLSQEAISDTSLLVNLYSELAQAHQQAGNLTAALQALDQAIELDPDQLALYMLKAGLLEALQKPEATLECLENALRLDSNNPELHYRLAVLLNGQGDLPGALTHAEAAASALVDSKNIVPAQSDLAHSVRLLAAELAYLMLKPQEAWAYLKADLSRSTPACEHFEHACLRAELALDAGEAGLAAGDVALISNKAPEQALSLANRARLAALQNDQAAGFELFKSALRAWLALQPAVQVEQPQGIPLDRVANLRAVCRAALEFAQWDDALSLSRRLVDRAAQEPLSNLHLAQVLITRAEAQGLRLSLDVRQHLLGSAALSEEARKEFEDSLDTAQAQACGEEKAASGDALPGANNEAQQLVDQWRARGRAAFTPEPQSAQALAKVLKIAPARPEEVAALVMVLRRNWEQAGTLKTAQVDWLSPFEGVEAIRHPLVMTQIALTLAEADPKKAMEVATSALDALNGSSCGGGLEKPMLQFLLARLAHQNSLETTALQSIQKALEAWTDESRWHGLAATIYLAEDMATGLPDLAKAQMHLEKAAALEPDYAPNLLALGHLYLQNGDAKRAKTVLEKASQLAPNQAEVWLALAQAQLASGDLEQAAASAEKAIELAADPTEALLLRGEIALKANNPRGALSRAQTILRTETENPRGLYLLARALEALNRPDEALTALDKAMSLMDDPLPMQLERVYLLRRSRDLDVALPALQALVERYPGQAELLVLQAEWLAEAGKSEAAVQAARSALQGEAVELSPQRKAGLYYLVGSQMRRSGQLDQAIQHLNEAIQEWPDHLEAYLELGRAHQERREYKQALKVYQKATNIAPNDYRPYYQAGLVLKDSKDYLAAEAMLRKAAQLAPNEVSIHRLLGAVVALNLVHNRRLTSSQA